MILEIYGDGLTKKDKLSTNIKTGCRGIVTKDSQYLIVKDKRNVFTLPGGGLEDGETIEECVVREVLEETGIVSTSPIKMCVIKEYYQDSTWINYFFLCKYVNETDTISLTSEEIDNELTHIWLSFNEIMNKWEEPNLIFDQGNNIHQREMLGFINSI